MTEIPQPDGAYGPDLFASDQTGPPFSQIVNEPLPRGTEGGLIESVKRAVIQGMREALTESGVNNPAQPLYVDLEYPLKQAQYPGVWVQFSLSEIKRMGVAHEVVALNPDTGDWDVIQEWQFNGRITLTIAALTSLDRDRLADQVVTQLAFSRTPDPVITKPGRNSQRYRALVTALDNNPYISMTINTDVIASGGQSVTPGVPWQQDVLLYEDNYGVDCHGQFNVRYSDGVYTLAAIQTEPEPVSKMPRTNSLTWWPGSRGLRGQ